MEEVAVVVVMGVREKETVDSIILRKKMREVESCIG